MRTVETYAQMAQRCELAAEDAVGADRQQLEKLAKTYRVLVKSSELVERANQWRESLKTYEAMREVRRRR